MENMLVMWKEEVEVLPEPATLSTITELFGREKTRLFLLNALLLGCYLFETMVLLLMLAALSSLLATSVAWPGESAS
jgi:hypothetical protein